MTGISLVLFVLIVVFFLPNMIKRYRYRQEIKCNCATCSEVKKTQLVLFIYYTCCTIGSLTVITIVGH